MEVFVGNFKKNPSCPHGPCLLFERYTSSGSKSGRKFFACSACRDRAECAFFQWADEDFSEKKKQLWEKVKQEKAPPFSHEDYIRQLENFKTLPADSQKYCRTCSLLILDQSEKHLEHSVFENVTAEHLIQPTLLFEVRENKKVEAQYFFSEATIEFLVPLLKDLGFSKIISIGVPKIHEYIMRYKSNEMSSLLLDIDYRYMQFFTSEQFCHYNVFNNFFFGGKESKKHFKNYLLENPNEKIVILLDPPFGGLIDAIAYSLKKINKWWQRKNNYQDKNVPMMWVFPYFHEGRILKCLPDMKMMDYKVEYSNHDKFKKSKSKPSPVRIFTNIEASGFALPTKDGYRFCAECKRYVSEENQHCSKCKACTTKHGKTYHHCDICKQCVKPSHIHCQKCNKCALPSSSNMKICKDCQCDSTENNQGKLYKCYKCNGIGHRKRSCPESHKRHNKKRKHKV